MTADVSVAAPAPETVTLPVDLTVHDYAENEKPDWVTSFKIESASMEESWGGDEYWRLALSVNGTDFFGWNADGWDWQTTDGDTFNLDTFTGDPDQADALSEWLYEVCQDFKYAYMQAIRDAHTAATRIAMGVMNHVINEE